MPEVDSAAPGFSSGESERLLVSNGKQVKLIVLDLFKHVGCLKSELKRGRN